MPKPFYTEPKPTLPPLQIEMKKKEGLHKH